MRRRRYDAALLVTASHNPAGWNGVKVRTFPGIPPDRALEDEIDRAVASGAVAAGQPAATLDAAALDGLVSEHHDHALRCFPELGSPPVSAPRVVVDGVHGIAGQALARLCQRLGWRVLALGTDPRPDFGGLVPDPTRARTRARAAAAVTAAGADFGLVLDGDGDRLWLVDDQGRTVQPHHLFALLLQQEGMWAQDTATARAPVAVTVSCGSVVAQVCSAQGRRVLERAIGFKHVAPLLASGEVGAGAGSVGDLAFARFSADRDPAFAVAMLAALLRRAAPARLRGLVSALIQRYGATSWEERYLPGVDQDEASLHRQAEAALAAEGLLAGVREVTRVDGVKFWLGDGQWLLLRPASTEPGIRVFSEMRDPGAQQRLLGRLCEALYAHVTGGSP